MLYLMEGERTTKRDFFDHMHTIMQEHEDVIFIMLGLGYPRTDEFVGRYPGRAFNFEASEQAGLDAAVGFAYAGKTPIIYSITPFLLYRGFETWRTYFDHENLHVIGIGAGQDGDYSDHGDGYSHDAKDAKEIMSTLKNVKQYYPQTKEEMIANLEVSISSRVPSFLNIHR